MIYDDDDACNAISTYFNEFFNYENIVPPRWIVEPQDQSAVLGNSVIITCRADGFPIPVVQWKQSIGMNKIIFMTLNVGKQKKFQENNPASIVI